MSRCVNGCSLFSLGALPRRQLVAPHSTPNLIWLSRKNSAARLLHGRFEFPGATLKTRAIPSSFFLGASTPTAPRDLSVLVPISALLLFVYWIANFVVPDLVYKDLLSDKSSTDDVDNNPLNDNITNNTDKDSGDDADDEQIKSLVTATRPRPKGFNSTRPRKN